MAFGAVNPGSNPGGAINDKMIKLINYLGQLRLYSLVDLILLLIAAKASNYELIGALLLHISFLIYLESRHKHKYRENIPNIIWIILLIMGIFFYKKIEVVFFMLFSILYTNKTNKNFGSFSPFYRGLQYFFLIGGIAGYSSIITWLALLLMFIRNFTGDLRDVSKDRVDKMITLPIVFGIKNDIKYIHFIFIVITSIIWWSFTTLSYIWLIAVFVIQAITYNLTPR